MSGKYKVLIRSCPDYHLEQIKEIIAKGIEELGTRPFGKVLLKYNMVFAHPRMGRYAYTHPRILEAIIDLVSEFPQVKEIILGERTGVYVPSRYHFLRAGYNYLRKKPKVKVCFFDEDELVEVELKKASFHKKIKLSRTLLEADYLIYAPKLKHHVSTHLTCTLKLNIGICDRRQRLDGHDWHLEEKIADLYEVGHPDLVVVDAVVIGQQCEIFPKPLELGAIVMGTSGLAVDSVCARIIGFQPEEIKHLTIARQRGWEPSSDEKIELRSELSWEEIQQKTKNFDYSFSDLSRIDTPIRFFLGNYPGGNQPCWGGCINMLKGALAGFDAFKPGILKRARPLAMVIGEYPGDVDGKGEPILLIGNCTRILGEAKGKTIRIRGCPVAIPFFTAQVPYYLKIPSPLLGEPPKELYYFLSCLAGAYLNKFKNRGIKKLFRLKRVKLFPLPEKERR